MNKTFFILRKIEDERHKKNNKLKQECYENQEKIE